MRILKFGGTSLATPEIRARVARIVAARAESDELVVVASALAGVTDRLAACLAGSLPAEALLRELEARHLEAPDLLADERKTVHQRLRELASFLAAGSGSGFSHRVLAAGERLALPLLASHLRRLGAEVECIDGSEVVETSPAGEIDLEGTRRRAGARLLPGEATRIRLVTGFVAADREGRTTTLGRGASDLSATLLAAVLPATEVEIWTDVDGVLSAPPDLVAGPRCLPRLTYGEAAALAHFGARILHPLALAPVREHGIPVQIRNTFHPAAEGTRITRGAPDGEGVRAVTAVLGASRLWVRIPWNLRSASRVLGHLEESGIQPLFSSRSASAETLSLVVRGAEADRAEGLLVGALGPEVEIERCDRLSALAAVGGTGSRAISVEQRLLQALDEHGIEPLAIHRPGSLTPEAEHCVVALLRDHQTPAALRGLHDRLVGETGPACAQGPPTVRSAQIRHEPLIRLL